MHSLIHSVLTSIQCSPTPFHTIETAAAHLNNSDFRFLPESSRWNLEAGMQAYTIRNGSSLIAFRLPKKQPRRCLISAAHSDSPAFRLKDHAVLVSPQPYLRLNTEKYGGMIFSTWLDRPLSIAGRVFVERDGSLKQITVNLSDETVLIPSVAIHLNREVNKGYALNPAKDLVPLFGLEEDDSRFLQLLSDAAGVKSDDILGSDLYLYNKDAGIVWGTPDSPFVSAPRLDDLECAFTTLDGFLKASTSEDAIQILCIFDNEEVGSHTKQGAASTLLSDVLSRIFAQTAPETEQQKMILSESFMLSADNAHAMHPNFPELTDKENVPQLNRGFVLKQNAEQKYATDGYSAAYCKMLANSAGIPVQSYANRSDMPGGSTLGSISNTVVSIPTADVGLAQLAMHSAYETAGALDMEAMSKLAKALFEH